jgi:hypothetical protein
MGVGEETHILSEQNSLFFVFCDCGILNKCDIGSLQNVRD